MAFILLLNLDSIAIVIINLALTAITLGWKFWENDIYCPNVHKWLLHRIESNWNFGFNQKVHRSKL